MSAHVEVAMRDLRSFMFEHVYTNPVAKSEEAKAANLLTGLFEYYMKHPDELPAEYLDMMKEREQAMDRTICDYIAGMTDQYAIAKFQEFYVPKAWSV